MMLLALGRNATASAPEDGFAASGVPHFEPLPMLNAQPALKPQAYVADNVPNATASDAGAPTTTAPAATAASLPSAVPKTPDKTQIAPQSAIVPPNASQPPAQPASTETQPATEVKPVVAIPPNNGPSDVSDTGEAPPKYIEKEGPKGKIIYVERPEDSKLILELVMDDRVTVLTSELEAWQVNETLLVPLGKFAQLLRFPIKVDTGAGTATGWFINPDNKFSLSYPFKSATVAGKEVTVPNTLIEAHLDDIYVNIETLQAWFPVKLTLNYNELRLYLKTLKELPFEAESKRQAQWESLQKNQAQQPGLDYNPKDLIKLPYRMYSAPVVQVSQGVNLLHTPGGNTTTTSDGAVAQMDLLGMSARFSGNFQTSTSDTEQLTGVTAHLSKEDYDGQLLGPLHATRYEMGDISSVSFPLAGQEAGRGALVTNQPYNFVSDANSFRINGFGPVGWDVEVFQNNDLLAFGHTGPDGRYEFDALPLNQGFNLFKVILYGPNGEQETRYERFYLGQNMVPKGKLYYSASALQSSSPLVDVSASPAAKTSGTVSLTGEYGVTNYLSAMMGYFRGPVANSSLDGVGLGLRTSGGSTYAQMNTFYDRSGGQSSSVLVTGNLTDTSSFNLTHTLHLGYDPGIYTTPRRTAGSVSNLFNLGNDIVPSVNVTLGAAKEQEDTGQVKIEYTNRVATNFLGLSLSNDLEKDTFDDGTPDAYLGTFSARYRAPIGIIHTDMTYHFLHPFELTAGSITLQKELSERLTLNAGVSHTFGATPLSTLTTSVDWALPRVRLGLAGSMDTQKNKQIGITATYTLVPQSLSGNYMVSGNTDDLNTGRLVLRPFVDTNGDGVWEAGEPLVKDVAFRNLLRGGTSTPADDGLATVGGLTPSLANRITIDDRSVTDLSLAPEKKQLVVLGRSGVNGPIDYPFSKSGDISGTLLAPNGQGEDTPIEGIHMQLVAASGKVVAEAYSEFDGYFAFEHIALGKYQIMFPPSPQLQARYTGNGAGPSLVVGTEHPDIPNLRLRLEHDRISDLSDSQRKTAVNNSSPPVQKPVATTPLPFTGLPINQNKLNGMPAK